MDFFFSYPLFLITPSQFSFCLFFIFNEPQTSQAAVGPRPLGGGAGPGPLQDEGPKTGLRASWLQNRQALCEAVS